MKKFIPTLLAIAAFAGLFWWTQASGFDGKVDEEEKPSKEEAVWDIEKKNIETVTIEREDGPLKFRKEKDLWQATEPQPFPVSGVTVDTFVSSVAYLKGEPVQKDEQDAADFGLDNPTATVKLSLKGGKSAELLIGEETPVEEKRYVQAKGEEKVYMVSKFTLENIYGPADKFMEKTTWAVDEEKTTSLTLKWGNEDVQLTKEKDRWEANGKKLSAEKAGSILNSVDAVTAQGLPVEKKPNQSDFKLTIETEKGSEEWIGTIDGEEVLVQKKGGKWIYPLAKEDVDNMMKEVQKVLKEKEEKGEESKGSDT